MKCCIILHNMCVEYQTADELEEEVANGEVVVGSGINPMCGSLVRLTGQRVIPADVSSVAAVCKTARFMEEESEYKLTKRLLVQHIWDRFGESAVQKTDTIFP